MDRGRFNNPEYKRQISAIRGYKRHVQLRNDDDRPRTFWEIIGLGTVLRKVLAGVIILLAVYLIYFAPFLKISKIEVNGADPQASANLVDISREYLHRYSSIFPQDNILFFSSAKYKQYALKNDLQLSGIKSVNRKFFDTVQVTVDQRVPVFIFQSQAGDQYLLNSDGTLSSRLISVATQYPLIIDSNTETVSEGQRVLDEKKNAFMSYVKDKLSSILGLPIDHYEVLGVVAPDIIVYPKNGPKIYFDGTTDPQKYLDRLTALWNGFTSAQQKKLAYLDLRFDPRAYGCYKGDLCDDASHAAQNSVAPTPTATPTPNITPKK